MSSVISERLGVFVKRQKRPLHVSRVRVILLALFLLLTFRVFESFPGMRYLQVSWTVLLFISAIFVYLPLKSLEYGRFRIVEVYILLMMLAIPFYAAVVAQIRFAQPLMYGVLSQRWMYYGIGALWIGTALRRHLFSLADLESAAVALSWSLLALYTLITLFLSAGQFSAYKGFVGHGAGEQLTFRFDNTFIIFGFLYYSFTGVRNRSLRSYLAACPFLMFMIFVTGGRSEIVCALGAFLFFAMRWTRRSRRATLILKGLVGVALVAAVLVVWPVPYISGLASRTSMAMTVALTGVEGADASANARISESLVAKSYLHDHWLIGNGAISEQWNGGYGGVLGAYFYPSDIGLLGIVFVYGVFGLLAFSVQLWIAYRAARAMRMLKWHSRFSDALQGLILFVTVRSLATGGYAWRWSVCVALVVILCYMRRQARLMAPADHDRRIA